MQQSDIIFSFLFPTNQNSAEAIHPTMGALYHPSSGLETGFLFNGLSFFTARANMGGKTKLCQYLPHLIEVKTFIHTHSLWFFRANFRALNGDAFNSSSHQFHIMAIGAFHCQPDRYSCPFSQQRPFDTFFRPVSRVRTGFFPHPKALWSCSHPCSTNPTQSLLAHHILPALFAKTSKILLLLPTLENGHELSSHCKYRYYPELSIGCRYAARKKYHPGIDDPALVVCPHQTGEYSHVWVLMAQTCSTIYLKLDTLLTGWLPFFILRIYALLLVLSASEGYSDRFLVEQYAIKAINMWLLEHELRPEMDAIINTSFSTLPKAAPVHRHYAASSSKYNPPNYDNIATTHEKVSHEKEKSKINPPDFQSNVAARQDKTPVKGKDKDKPSAYKSNAVAQGSGNPGRQNNKSNLPAYKGRGTTYLTIEAFTNSYFLVYQNEDMNIRTGDEFLIVRTLDNAHKPVGIAEVVRTQGEKVVLQHLMFENFKLSYQDKLEYER